MPSTSTLFYVAHTQNKMNLSNTVKTYYFNILNENTIHKIKASLIKEFARIEKTDQHMLLICDWSNGMAHKYELFLPFLNNLIKNSQNLSPPGWKRRYQQKQQQKLPLILINAFNTTNIDTALISNIVEMHQKVYLLQKNYNIFFLPTLSPYLETIFPKSHVLPQTMLEKLAKDNLELITLLFLEKGAKSGYSILKEIATHFHCILSQGTLYPLLYQLEKQDKIIKQNGKGREIIYSLTPEMLNELKSKKEMQLNAYQHLASFFESL